MSTHVLRSTIPKQIQFERAHREINTKLRILLDKQPMNRLSQELDKALLSYRITPNSYGISPYQAVYGADPILPIDIFLGTAITKLRANTSPFLLPALNAIQNSSLLLKQLERGPTVAIEPFDLRIPEELPKPDYEGFFDYSQPFFQTASASEYSDQLINPFGLPKLPNDDTYDWPNQPTTSSNPQNIRDSRRKRHDSPRPASTAGPTSSAHPPLRRPLFEPDAHPTATPNCSVLTPDQSCRTDRSQRIDNLIQRVEQQIRRRHDLNQKDNKCRPVVFQPDDRVDLWRPLDFLHPERGRKYARHWSGPYVVVEHCWEKPWRVTI
jgi:hypothetical protein